MKKNSKWIGLTGGLASGKGAAAQFFKKKNIPVINLDEIGKEINKTKKVKSFYKNLLGNNAVIKRELNKAFIRETLFESSSARKKAERFLHPIIWKVFLSRVKKHKFHPLIICESALLIEKRFYKYFDAIILITAPIKTRRQRALQRDKISATLFKRINNSQFPDKKKKKHTDFVIANNSNIKKLHTKLNIIFKKIT